MGAIQKMMVSFDAIADNVSFARTTVAAFISRMDPTLEEIEDIKTVVSEAVSNAIIHGYRDNSLGTVYLETEIDQQAITIIVTDEGCGMENIEQAREATYTSRPDLERSGMGYTIMEHLMDDIEIISVLGKGTKIIMRKKLQHTVPVN